MFIYIQFQNRQNQPVVIQIRSVIDFGRQDWGRVGLLTGKGYTEIFWCEKNVLCLDIRQNGLNDILRFEHFTVCKLQLNIKCEGALPLNTMFLLMHQRLGGIFLFFILRLLPCNCPIRVTYPRMGSTTNTLQRTWILYQGTELNQIFYCWRKKKTNSYMDHTECIGSKKRI